MKTRVMISHPSAIVRRGIMSLTEEVSDGVCEFISAGASAGRIQDADIYIIDAGTFVQELDFYLSRRERVAVVGDGEVSRCGGVMRIGMASTVEDVKDALNELLSRVGDTSEPVHMELSNRELDVLREIGRGKSFKEIADTLFISVNTVTTHRKNISAKLGIRTVSGLSVYAHLNNIVSDDFV